MRTGGRPHHLFEPKDSADNLVIRFNRVDTSGPWCLSRIDGREHTKLLARLRDIESMRVRDVFNNGDEPGKHYEAERCPNPALVRRLRDLEYDDETRISRLRFGGRGRLFGFLRGNQFFALWWDPEHEVWPSKKRNT
jgi:hypothetical protein